MAEDLVDVYEAADLVEAQLLAAQLEAEGIQSFIDNASSPLDGLTAAQQVHAVRVLPADAERAREIAEAFDAESPGPAVSSDFSEFPESEEEASDDEDPRR